MCMGTIMMAVYSCHRSYIKWACVYVYNRHAWILLVIISVADSLLRSVIVLLEGRMTKKKPYEVETQNSLNGSFEIIDDAKPKDLKDLVSKDDYTDMMDAIPSDDQEYVTAVIVAIDGECYGVKLHMGSYMASKDCRVTFNGIIERGDHGEWRHFEREMIASHWFYARTDTFVVYNRDTEEFLEFLPEDDLTSVSFNTYKGYYKQHCLNGKFKLKPMNTLDTGIDNTVKDLLFQYYECFDDEKQGIHTQELELSIWKYLTGKYEKVFKSSALLQQPNYSTIEDDIFADEFGEPLDNSFLMESGEQWEHMNKKRHDQIINYINEQREIQTKMEYLKSTESAEEHMKTIEEIKSHNQVLHPNRSHNRKLLRSNKAVLEPRNEYMSSVQHHDIHGDVLMIHHLQMSVGNDPIIEVTQKLIHADSKTLAQVFNWKQKTYFNMNVDSQQTIHEIINKLIFYYYLVYRKNGNLFTAWFLYYFRHQWKDTFPEEERRMIRSNFPKWIDIQRDKMQTNATLLGKRHRWNMIYDAVRTLALSILFLMFFFIFILPLIK